MQSTVAYFEIILVDFVGKCTLYVGVAEKTIALNTKPGWEPRSVSVCSDDGKLYRGARPEPYGSSFGREDVVGCGYAASKDSLFFTKNGKVFGLLPLPGPLHLLFPTVAVVSSSALLSINFNDPFRFELSAFMASRLQKSGRSSPVPASPKGTLEPSADLVAAKGIKILKDRLTARRDRADGMASVQSVRGLHQLVSFGVGYFEVTVLSIDPTSRLCVGLAPKREKKFKLTTFPGAVVKSFGVTLSDGAARFGGESCAGLNVAEVRAGDVVGCGCVMADGAVFVTVNGALRGGVDLGLKGFMYPTAGLDSSNDCVSFNIGYRPFLFDVTRDNIVEDIRRLVSSSPKHTLANPIDEDTADDDLTDRDEEMAAASEEKATPIKRDRGPWRKGELVGTGAFGRVYKGMSEHTGQLVAMKEFQLVGQEEHVAATMKGLAVEIEILQQLSHPNIVQYLGYLKQEHTFAIILEYCPGGSIATKLKQFGAFPEEVCKRATKGILTGLAYLHNRRIVHRDIKGGNVMTMADGAVKLADFGTSKQLSLLQTASREMKTVIGTPYWMAPEIIREEGYGRKADIWSVGCTVIEMLTAKPPWHEYNSPISALFQIASTNKMPSIPPSLSPECVDFIELCLQRDPSKRPRADELLLHPFLVTP